MNLKNIRLRLRKRIKDMNLELKILYFGILLVILFILITKLNLIRNPFLLDDYNELKDVISTNATIIGTIFAITISLTLLGFQYLSQTISPKTLYIFLKSRFITGMIILYLFSILFNIFVLSFCRDNIYVYFSYLLLSLCLVYLVSYIYYVVNHLQPQNVLIQIGKSISNYNYWDENYMALEEATIKAIRNNDYLTFLFSLGIIFDKERNFLNKLLDQKTYTSRDIEKIFSLFFRIQEQIYFETIKDKNTLFLSHYIENLANIHTILLKLMAIEPYQTIRGHFNDIGFKIVELKLQNIYVRYWSCLEEITMEEFKSISSGNLIFPFQDKLKDIDDLNEIEKKKWFFGEEIFRDFQYVSLNFLVEFSKKVSDEKIEMLVHLIMSTLSRILGAVVKKGDNKKMQDLLARSILEKMRDIHIYALEKGLNKIPVYLSSFSLRDILIDMQDEEIIDTIGLLITKYCCSAEIENTKRDVYNFLNPLGITGRSLITIPRFEKILDEIVNCLIEILELTIKNKNFEKVKKEYIIRELLSIRDFENHKNEKIRNKINKVIKKYNL